MALSVIERKILEGARRFVLGKKEKYVCYAIDRVLVAGADQQELDTAKRRLTKYIEFRLGEHPTLGSWAAKKNGGRWMNEDLQSKARVAWITWMLGELDENGPVPVRLRN